MPLHDVAVERSAGRQAGFEVHLGTDCEAAEAGAIQGFGGKVANEAALIFFDHGQAAAADGDAGGDTEFGEHALAFDAQAPTLGVAGKFGDGADFFDDSGKHR